MRTFVVAALVTGLAWPELALADDTLTLPQVLAAAVRQAPDLERATIDMRVAEASLLRAKGIEDTHLGANGTFSQLHQGTLDETVTNGTVGVSKPLSTGTVLGVEIGTGYSTQAVYNSMNQIQQPGYQTTGSITLTQPILRGGWNGFEAPIKDAEHQRDAAALSRDARARTLIVQIAEAYWQVALARESWNVRKASLELANKQLAFTQEQIRVDKVAKSEEFSVKQVIATRQQDVIAAEQQVYERSLALRELAGLEIGPTNLDVVTDPLTSIADDKLEIPATVAAALEHSSELASLTATVKAAQENIKTADNGGRARLDVSVVGGTLGTDAKFGQSVKRAAQGDGYQITGNLTFDTALERRGEKGTIGQAHERLVRAQVDERAARARISSQAVRIVQRIKAASASVKLSDEAIGLAQQNIDAENKRFLLGKSTNFDVLRRQDELEGAKLRRVTSIVDYLSARAELDALTGAIFTRFGIAMK